MCEELQHLAKFSALLLVSLRYVATKEPHTRCPTARDSDASIICLNCCRIVVIRVQVFNARCRASVTISGADCPGTVDVEILRPVEVDVNDGRPGGCVQLGHLALGDDLLGRVDSYLNTLQMKHTCCHCLLSHEGGQAPSCWYRDRRAFQNHLLVPASL